MTCLISGAASGIGLASAELISATMPVVLADIDADALARAEASLRRRGADVVSIVCDVRDPAACAAAVYEAEELGGITDVVSSAGILRDDGALLDTTAETWRFILDVNLVGPANLARAALPSLLARGGGDIVLVGSAAALQGRPRVSAYSASKTGLLGLQQALVADYARKGVRTNSVCPGSTDTPMTRRRGTWIPNAIGAAARPEQVAAAIAWFVADTSDHIVGAVLPVDAGETAASSQSFEPT